MNIGQKVTINMPNTVWDKKEGIIESINDNTCVVFVDFIPEEGKKVRQEFNLDNIAKDDYNNVDMKETLIEEKSNNLDAYLNPRTRRVWNGKEWIDRPVTWNKLLKLPLELKDVMSMSRDELEDIYDINEIKIDLDNLWSICDDYSYGFQVCRAGEPWKQWKKNGLQNETEVKNFNTLQDAYNFYLERSDNKDISKNYKENKNG